jgi:hypothetical protein
MIINSYQGRYYYSLGYRYLQAGYNNSIYLGYESHWYDYMVIPLVVQLDWISLLNYSVVMGTFQYPTGYSFVRDFPIVLLK